MDGISSASANFMRFDRNNTEQQATANKPELTGSSEPMGYAPIPMESYAQPRPDDGTSHSYEGIGNLGEYDVVTFSEPEIPGGAIMRPEDFPPGHPLYEAPPADHCETANPEVTINELIVENQEFDPGSLTGWPLPIQPNPANNPAMMPGSLINPPTGVPWITPHFTNPVSNPIPGSTNPVDPQELMHIHPPQMPEIAMAYDEWANG